MMFAQYALWHYSRALSSGVQLFKNFVVFLFHFFSIPLLTRTLFAKFGRLGEHYQKGLDIQNILSVFLVNTLMRLVGAILRIALILSGFLSILILSVCSFVLFIFWLLFPLIIIMAFVYGISVLI